MMVQTKEKDSTETIYDIIGQNIKRVRKQRGITQEKLANLTNLSYGFIKNLEAKRVHATVSLATLSLIARALETDVVELVKER